MFAFIFREVANKISSTRQSCSPMSPLVVITATLRVTVLAVIVVISSTIVILGVCVGPWIVVVSLVVVVSRAVILLKLSFYERVSFRFKLRLLADVPTRDAIGVAPVVEC